MFYSLIYVNFIRNSMIIIMLQTLEASADKNIDKVNDIIAHSEQVVMRNENVYFKVNEDYEI